MKKLLGILVLGLLLNNSAFADKKFDKDLLKVSKLNSFVNNNGEPYELKKNIDKTKTVIIIYNHGANGQNRTVKGCKPKWAKIPSAIYQLDGIIINGLIVKTYQLCSGVRGWTQKDEDTFWDVYDKNNQDPTKALELVDKNGVLLIEKERMFKKRKVMKLKIDEFKSKGFNNIVLAGHSAGGWESLNLKSNFSSEIDGVIAFNPARSGRYAKELKKGKVWRGWHNWRNYKISLIKLDKLDNVLVYSHNLDDHETPKTLSFLSNLDEVQFVDLSNSGCKAKLLLGGYHGITLTKCFATYDRKNKSIVRYLEQIK